MGSRRLVWFLAWVRTTVAFLTITVPIWIYAILSYSLTLRLNFVSLVTIFVFCLIGGSYFIRFKYLNTYSELKELPLGKPDVTELHPDVQGEEEPTTFHGYLDEFLAAVRIFGFLEKPVFHELARHLQTRRLIAGDSLALDQDQNFYCVIEGLVQVYAPSGRPTDDRDDDAWAEEEMNGYQLLNEVGSGGTLSSLFTILSLFTENVRLSWRDDKAESSSPGDASDAGSHSTGRQPRSRLRRSNSDVSNLDLRTSVTATTPQEQTRPAPLASPLSFISGSRQQGVTTPMLGAYPFSPSQVTTPGTDRTFSPSSPIRREHPPFGASHLRRGLVARAAHDSTLAVIPAEAFRRVTKKFPKASAHIIQVILTRFSRVTFNAAHKYLGLTTELLRTEKAINDLACHPLPTSFYEGGGMQNLRNKFAPDISDDKDEDEDEDTITNASTIGLDSEDDYFGFGSSNDTWDPITPASNLRHR
ncbi:phosphatidylcholine and lysophosphatidylcholine phospholipase, partial [Tulasnella sp. 403]